MEKGMDKSAQKLTSRKLSLSNKNNLHVSSAKAETNKEPLNKDNKDTPIHGLVVRVHLEQFDVEGYFTNKSKTLQPKEIATKERGELLKVLKVHLERLTSVNEFKKQEQQNEKALDDKKEDVELNSKNIALPQIKQKELNSKNLSLPQIKQKELNSKNISLPQIKQKELNSKNISLPQIKRKGLNSKNISLPQIKQKTVVKRLNSGSKLNVSQTSHARRIIKPNPRLQDFIISSGVRYYSQSPLNTPTKETTQPPKPKVKIIKKSVPNKVLNNSNKLKMSSNSKNDGDVVRSFLPVFDNNSQSGNDDNEDDDAGDILEKELAALDKNIKEKENKKADKIKLTPTKIKPLLVNGEHDPLNTTSITKPGVSVIKPIKLTNLPSQKRPNEDSMPDETTTTSPPPSLPVQKKQKLEGMEDKKKVTHTLVSTPSNKTVTKVNGSKALIKPETSGVKKYTLVDSGNGEFDKKNRKIFQPGNVDFNKLVRCLKLVKLPAPKWKIRIVVSKHQNITEVTFTNKEVNERCVKFSRTITGYTLTFGNSVVKLLGAPPEIVSHADVSILLDIVHNISINDPVLEYDRNIK